MVCACVCDGVLVCVCEKCVCVVGNKRTWGLWNLRTEKQKSAQNQQLASPDTHIGVNSNEHTSSSKEWSSPRSCSTMRMLTLRKTKEEKSQMNVRGQLNSFSSTHTFLFFAFFRSASSLRTKNMGLFHPKSFSLPFTHKRRQHVLDFSVHTWGARNPCRQSGSLPWAWYLRARRQWGSLPCTSQNTSISTMQ